MSTNDSFISYPKSTVIRSDINFDILAASTQMYNAPLVQNFGLNFRGNQSTTLVSLLPNKVITAKFIVVTTTKTVKPTVFRVDGALVYPDFVGASVPSTSTNSINEYTFDFFLLDSRLQVICRFGRFGPGSQTGSTPINKR